MCLTERAVARLSLARGGEMLTLKTRILLPGGRALSPCERLSQALFRAFWCFLERDLAWWDAIGICQQALQVVGACVFCVCPTLSCWCRRVTNQHVINVCHSASGVKRDARLLSFVSQDPVRFPGIVLWNEELLLFFRWENQYCVLCFALFTLLLSIKYNWCLPRIACRTTWLQGVVDRKTLHPYIVCHAGQDGARANVFYALRHIWLVDFWSLCWKREGKWDWELG